MITVTLFCREMSYVAIYALSGKKIIGQKFACVNFLTNIMLSGYTNEMQCSIGKAFPRHNR